MLFDSRVECAEEFWWVINFLGMIFIYQQCLHRWCKTMQSSYQIEQRVPQAALHYLLGISLFFVLCGDKTQVAVGIVSTSRLALMPLSNILFFFFFFSLKL